MDKATFWLVIAQSGEGAVGEKTFSLLRTYNPRVAQSVKHMAGIQANSECAPEYRRLVNAINRLW